jgi:hypothetical protein
MIREASRGVWCDYCKDRYGKDRTGQWNLKAMKQAWVTITSESERAKGIKRSYCRECADLVTRWHDGSLFTLNAQVEAAKTGEVLNV